MSIAFQTITPKDGSECSLCLETYSNTPENENLWVKAHNNSNAGLHPFHKSCIQKLVQYKALGERVVCPVCNEEIRPATPIDVDNLVRKYQLFSRLTRIANLACCASVGVTIYNAAMSTYHTYSNNSLSVEERNATAEAFIAITESYGRYVIGGVISMIITTESAYRLSNYTTSIARRILRLPQPPQNHLD